ncbi:MAG TPA: hypothetical protein VKR52_15195 [Terracidiphilus sp.]|nr:hypothetical protein [Terracidiphilus sp.]
MATIEGRPMRELIHEGTSIAVGEPVVTANGDYRVFVQVSHLGPGKVEVKPKDFSALYSDPAHTRFEFYDKLAEVSMRQAQQDAMSRGVAGADQPQDAGSLPSSGPVSSSGMVRRPPLENTKKPDPGYNDVMADGSNPQAASRPGTALKPEDLYLGRKTLRQGGSAEGFVYFRKPKRSKLQVGPQDSLYQIDIPVNGIVFRFNPVAPASQPAG